MYLTVRTCISVRFSHLVSDRARALTRDRLDDDEDYSAKIRSGDDMPDMPTSGSGIC